MTDTAVQATTHTNALRARVLHFHRVPLIVVFIVVIFFGLIRFRLRDMPLERDEGEYALSGYLMLQGIPPYKLAYNLKLPGTYAAYAAMLAVFGETPSGIHLGFLLVNAVTVLLMYFLAARLLGNIAGIVAAASYALLSTSPGILGFQAHATHFIVLPALGGILLLLSALDSQRQWIFFLSGVLSGIAFLMKQHGVFVPIFCFFYLLVEARKRAFPPARTSRLTTWFSLGIIAPGVITAWLLHHAGVFHQFWFWTVSYAGEYSKMGLRRGIRVFLANFHTVTAETALIWLLAALGLIALRWSPRARKHAWFLVSLLLLAFIAICPGVQFRPHYFVLLLPAISLFVAVAVGTATDIVALQGKSNYLIALPVAAFLTSFASTIYQQHVFYFSLTPEQALRSVYPADSGIFLSAPKIADYIREHSSPSSQLGVIGSEPEVYFYAHRLPATGYIYMYSLIEKQKYTDQMRQQMTREVETSRPDYLVYVDAWDSWGYQNAAAPQVQALFSWAKNYIAENYDRVGVAGLGKTIQYAFGDAAQTHAPYHHDVIFVFQRKKE